MGEFRALIIAAAFASALANSVASAASKSDSKCLDLGGVGSSTSCQRLPSGLCSGICPQTGTHCGTDAEGTCACVTSPPVLAPKQTRRRLE